MKEVRLRYAGTVGFVVRILTLFTGLVFVTIITRNLTVDEYGQWSIISSLLIYGIYIPSILPFWYTRFTARDIPVAKTGVFVTLLLSLSGIAVYLIAGRFFLPEFEKLFPVLIFASIQVISSSLIVSLASIASGIKPEYASYGIIVFEVIKVLMAFILVFGSGLELIDAIMIVIIAEIAHVVILAILIRKELRKKVEFNNIKKIFKSLWIPIYTKIGGLIYSSDILIANFLNVSYDFIAIFKIGFVFATIAEYGSYMAYPLYIKLLGGGKSQDINTSSKLMFTFSIPLSIGIILLAKPLLFLLNPEYVVAERIVQILVLYYFSSAVYALFYNIALGADKVDLTSDIKFKDLFHSSLFKFPTLNIVRMGIYLIGVVLLILTTYSIEIPPEKFGEFWALVLLISNIPVIIYSTKLARGVIKFSLPWKNIGKYVVASSIMGIFMWYITTFLQFESKVTLFAPQLIGIIVPSIILYLGILFVIDKDTKQLIFDTISFIKK